MVSRRDVMVAAVAVAATLAGTWRADLHQPAARPIDVAGYVLVGAVAVLLGGCRAAPVAVLAGTVGLAAGYLAAGYAYGPVLICVAWAMFECARRRPLLTSAAAGLVAAAVSVAVVGPRLAGSLELPALGLLLWAGWWLAVPWAVGALVQARAAAAARDREALVTRAVFAERMRVAREVHDVAGHGFAVVAMQAGVGLTVFDEQPAEARAALAAIRTTSVAVLDELRAVLDGTEAVPGDLVALTDRARAGGLPVTLRLGRLEGVPADALRVAHDVAREALTNVVRHADAAPTRVDVRKRRDALVLTVADAGRPPKEFVAGRGIEGMRTRVEAAGGTLSAGPSRTGFTVTATVPA
jgi:signal transduction histidine kinase